MGKSSSTLAEDFARKARTLEATRRNIESLRTRDLLSRRALLHAYEGLFLNIHVAFEGLIEDLFVGLLISNGGLTSSRSDIGPRVVIRSHAVARELVLGPGRGYADWLPYERTLERAKLFFRGGRPFTDVTDGDRQQLKKSSAIRNAIAHRSRHSLKKFEKVAIGSTPLPSGERRPAGFLSGRFRVSPSQTRYEDLVSQMLMIAHKLAH